ncbi:alpha/beta hydrolase [Stutzerimonas tarimensis]|uniref:Alpha/beta hydrolase n=1 Tax=Stutzerimonas tarimensis TaxID=1507735 RepID=A0ABV7T4W3_9GAMM
MPGRSAEYLNIIPRGETRVIQPELIRAELGDLDMAVGPSPAACEYLGFYGLDLSSRADVHIRQGKRQVGGYEVVLQLWTADEPRATLLVLHGYYDHMGLYRNVVAWGLARGFAVLGCDLPGHGLSSGAPASINEFAEYQVVLQALMAEAERLGLPQPWHLLGQSTGGAILLDHLLRQPAAARLGQSILLAPLVRPRAWARSRLSYQLLRHFVDGIPRQFSDNSGDRAFLEFQRRDPLQAATLPTAWVGALDRWIPQVEAAPACHYRPIIIQGEQDMTVDWRYNLPVLQAKFAQPEILRLADARHHLVNEREDIRREYFAFLDERLA